MINLSNSLENLGKVTPKKFLVKICVENDFPGCIFAAEHVSDTFRVIKVHKTMVFWFNAKSAICQFLGQYLNGS